MSTAWTEDRWRIVPVAACVLASLLALAWGFARTEVISAGLLEAWNGGGALRYAAFLGTAATGLVAAGLTRTPRAALAGLGAAWLLALFGVPAVAAAAYVLASALALGSVAAGPADLRGRFGVRVGALLSLAAGLGVLVAVTQLLVHFPINTAPLHATLLFAAIVGGRAWLVSDLRALGAFLGAREEGRRGVIGAVPILVVLAVHTVHAALPERGWDAVAMHLAVPTYVANHRHWGFDAARYAWAVFPMGGDWLYTITHLLGGEQAVRLFNFGLHAAVATLLHAELRERVPARSALLLTAIYAATPLAFLESATLFIENALSLFVLAGAVLLARGWRSGRAADLPLIALYAGAALATKLLALFAVVPMGALAIRSAARAVGKRRLLGACAGAAAVLALVGAVPYGYAWLATGNPVFPFLNHVFASPLFPVREFKDTRWMGHLDWNVLYEMVFRSGRFGELWHGSFGFQHLLLLPAGLVAAALSWRRACWPPILVGLCYVAGVLAQIQYIRYLYPVFPLLALAQAEAFRIAALPALRAGLDVLAAGALALNLVFMPTGGGVLKGFELRAAFSVRARERLVEQTLPHRVLLRLASATDGRRARVLVIGTPVGIELAGVPIYANWYNSTALEMLERAATRQDVDALVAAYELTHVLQDGTVPVNPVLGAYLDENARLVRRIGSTSLHRLAAP